MAAALAGLAVLGLAHSAAAHRLAPSLLELREQADGEILLRWKTPLQRPAGVEIDPVLPPHCAATSSPVAVPEATSVTLRWSLRCAEPGLVGSELSVTGLAESATNAIVSLELADGRRFRAVIHADEPVFVVPARQEPLDVAHGYGLLGFEHILTGLDHLLFVLGLVLLVESRRLLLYTVTSFTLGHSVTLSLAALGYVNFPSGLVEVVIALTIVLLAAELARGRLATPSLMRRFPWAMAFLFGLLHGLGFAGALAEIGLPQEEIPLALLSFNVGIEIGQLAFVAVVLVARMLAWSAVERAPAWVLRAPVYGMGSVAAYWCYDRVAGLF
jgi:hydrogenase/urease accessory protein HupE